MSFELRDYQASCLEAIRWGFLQHQSVAVELATGLGKTVIFTKLASEWTNGRCLVVAPQIPLISQAASKISRETGMMPAIEQADQWSNETEWGQSPIVVASKQSLTRRRKNGSYRFERLTGIGLLIIDEAHYACTEPYKRMVDHYVDRGASVLGVSATLKRHDKRAVGQLFDECVFQYGIVDAIEDGWLVKPQVICKQLEKLDLSDVETGTTPMGKDFKAKQLNEKLENPEVIYEIAEAVNQETRGEKTVVYCSSVDEAQAVAELLEDRYKIDAGWVCADTRRCTPQRRLETMRSFHDPEGMTHLCNVGILTVGWDYPALKNIVMARPTQSLPLYTQIFGRGTRPLDGVVDFAGGTPETRKQRIADSDKPYFRVIDLVDNSMQHKIRTATDVLGGRWSLAVQERVKGMLDKVNGPIDLDEAAIEARQAIEREEERKRRQQRARVEARARYKDRQVDPFGRASGTSSRRSQKVLATQKQLAYLAVNKIPHDPKTISKRQAGRIIGQHKSGMSVDQIKRTNRITPEPKGKPVEIDEVNKLLQTL